jgi:hypothetical protein
MFASQKDMDLLPLVEMIRHSVFHGSYTPTSSGFATDPDVRLLMDLVKHLTLDLIEAFPLIPWDWTRVSQNPNLTLDYVLAHPERPWDWDLINYSMPMTTGVADFRRRALVCDPTKLSYNPSVQLRDVLENPDSGRFDAR